MGKWMWKVIEFIWRFRGFVPAFDFRIGEEDDEDDEDGHPKQASCTARVSSYHSD